MFNRDKTLHFLAGKAVSVLFFLAFLAIMVEAFGHSIVAGAMSAAVAMMNAKAIGQLKEAWDERRALAGRVVDHLDAYVTEAGGIIGATICFAIYMIWLGARIGGV